MEIQALELKISAQTQEATKSINSLKKSLDGLNKVVSAKSVESLAEGFKRLNSALGNIDTSGIDHLKDYTKALDELGNAISKVTQWSKGKGGVGASVEAGKQAYKRAISGTSLTDSEARLKRQGDLESAFKYMPEGYGATARPYGMTKEIQGESDKWVEITRGSTSKISEVFKTIGVGGQVAFGAVSYAAGKALKPLKEFFSSLKRIAMYRLIRSALKAIGEGFEIGIQNMALYSSAMNGLDSHNANKWLSELASKGQEVSNAIGSACIPVIQALTPIILWLADALIYCVNAFNMFISALQGGKTFTKASAGAVDYAKSLDKATGSANALKDATTGIDELNVINQGSSGGGGSTATNPLDMFSEELISPKILENLDLIKNLAIAIGAAFIAWKIASAFTDSLGKVLGFTLLIAGIVLVIAGFVEFNKTGEVTAKTLAVIEAGIFAIGIGLSLLTGSWIPLLIAGIAGVVLGLAYMTGNAETILGGFMTMFNGVVQFVTSLVQGDFKGAFEGLAMIIEGAGQVVSGILDTVVDAFGMFIDQIDKWTKGKLTPLLEGIKETFSNIFDGIKQILQGVIDFVTGVFTGDWEKAWNGISAIFTGIWNTIISSLEGAINLIVDGINLLIDSINDFIGESFVGKALDKIGVEGGLIPNLPRASLPRLAEGGYVASGQLFMAREAGAEMVGSIGGRTAVANNDQIVQAVSEGVYSAVMSAMSGRGNETPTYNLYLDGKQLEYSVRTTKQKRGVAVATGGILNNAY